MLDVPPRNRSLDKLNPSQKQLTPNQYVRQGLIIVSDESVVAPRTLAKFGNTQPRMNHAH